MIQIIAVDQASFTPGEQEIEIAVVIEIDENRLANAPRIESAGARRDVFERAIGIIAQEPCLSACCYGEEIEPAVIIDIRNCSHRCGLSEGQSDLLTDFGDAIPLHAVQP